MTQDLLPVAVILLFQFSTEDRLAIEREANLSLAEEGIRIQLHELHTPVANAKPVAVFHQALGQSTLGRIHKANGELLGVIDVNYERIRELAGWNWTRVYARVLAHEVWHFVQQNEAHRPCGLFAPRLSHRLLLDPRLPYCYARGTNFKLTEFMQ